jgi:ABC-type Co2+ transport system permease subunit
MMDFTEIMKRIIKYLVEGLMVAIAAYAIPKRSLNVEEIVLIALTAAATFSILDTYIPSMGVSARTGAGFGTGPKRYPRSQPFGFCVSQLVEHLPCIT